MLFSLLDDTTSNWSSYLVLGVILVIFIVGFVLTSRRSKKKEQETKSMLDAIQPGNKVKTIGGICGVVVEVNKEENTFVLMTGGEDGEKCYIKFDKQAVYQTDAKPAGKEDKKEDQKAIAEEAAPAEEKTEEKAAEPAAAEEPKESGETGETKE